MYYSRRKLPLEVADRLLEVSIERIQAFHLMYSPVYLFLKKNSKFISVKAPLDFFVPSELDQLKSLKSLYFPEFLQSVKPIKFAAQKVKDILSAKMVLPWKNSDGSSLELLLTKIPYEISNEVLKILGPLWWDELGNDVCLEPFYVAVFVNELCDPIPEANLLHSREASVDDYEAALLLSSWMVFLSLHLGYSDIEFLNDLRVQIFQARLDNKQVEILDPELNKLIQLVGASLGNPDSIKSFNGNLFLSYPDKISQKLGSRLNRVKKELVSKGTPPSIFGARGFIDE